MSAPMTNKTTPNDDWLDSLFELIEWKIPEHHLKAKFIADCKQSVQSKIDEVEAKLEDKLRQVAMDAELSGYEKANLETNLVARKNELDLLGLATGFHFGNTEVNDYISKRYKELRTQLK